MWCNGTSSERPCRSDRLLRVGALSQSAHAVEGFFVGVVALPVRAGLLVVVGLTVVGVVVVATTTGGLP